MSTFHLVIALVALARGGELIYARRNTRRLLCEGGVEIGAAHYPLMVALHAAWLIAILLAIPADTSPQWFCLGPFLLLQIARLWVIVSLGRFWTTRIVSLPDAPLVRRGPYRFLRHPNYLIVELEILLLPLSFSAWTIAVIFGAANATLLAWRIRVENGALAARRSIIA